MNRLLTCALAIAAVGSVGSAGPGDGDWLELDSEINGLASTAAVQGDYMNIKALLRSFYNYSSDELAQVGGTDVSGFSLRDAEINGNFQVGDVKLRLGFDLREGIAVVQDAFAIYPINEDVSVRAGVYKGHVFRSNFTDPEKLFFPYRTALGAALDFYDQGAGVFGDMNQVSWSFDVFNGANRFGGGNGYLAGHHYLLRAVWNMGREPGQYEATPEDAYGAGDEPAFTVGGTIYEDDVTHGKAGLYGVDAQGTFGRVGFGAEVAVIGEDANLGIPGLSGWNALSQDLTFGDGSGSTTAFAVEGNWLANDRFGVGARYEDLDNADNNSVLTVGGNMYDAGHNGKIQAAVAFVSSDNFQDTTVFTLGYTFGSSR